MKLWRELLEAYSHLEDPAPPVFPHLRRFSVGERHQALVYLMNMGFLEPAGVVKGEMSVPMYRVTMTGRFMAHVARGHLQDSRRSRRAVEANGSLARRVSEKNPCSVFDLASKPWTWSLRKEQDRL